MKLMLELFFTFTKIGLFTLGGGFAMLPLIKAEIITKRGWIKEEDFLGMVTVAQSAPGPIALNTSVFVGYRLLGMKGAIISVIGIIIPSLISILLIAIFFSRVRENPVVDAAFKGMRPAVIALIAIPVLTLMKSIPRILWLVVLATALLVWQLELSPVILIILGALGGISWALYMNKKVKQ